MSKSTIVTAAHGRLAIFIAARKLGVPRTAKYKKLDRIGKGRWKVTF